MTHPQSAAAEAYRTLRTNLYFATLDMPAKSIIVAAPSPTEDKTTVLANLAVVMAQSGKRVIAVDADLRHPSLHERFGLQNEGGLSHILTRFEAGKEIALSDTGIPGLSILPSGMAQKSPLDLLDSPRMREIIRSLVAQADIVLFDSAPMITVSDTAILASQTDGVLMVIEIGKTRREHVQQSRDLLGRAHARLLGAVTLNP